LNPFFWVGLQNFELLTGAAFLSAGLKLITTTIYFNISVMRQVNLRGGKAAALVLLFSLVGMTLASIHVRI
jgi:hypothetical protein